jgi:hypothetical protein
VTRNTCLALGLLFCGLVTGAATAAPLPLERVRLYETGVGYFERQGSPRGGSRLELSVPASHLDDALKTLVVLNGQGKTTVDSIEFASSVSPELGRALTGLPADTSVPLGFLQLLRGLRGAPVELTSATGAMRGRVLDVLQTEDEDDRGCQRSADKSGKNAEPCRPRQESWVSFLSEAGEIRRLAVGEIRSLRPVDKALTTRLGAAASAGSRSARVERVLSVLGQGGETVRLGYVAESPVWQTSYRLVVAGGDRARLQGWALIHNDTEEAWHQVRVELSSGRPDSFLVPLAAPRYGRRELVAPEQVLSTVPQLLEHSLDSAQGSTWGVEIGDAFGAGGLGLSGVGEGGGGRGEGQEWGKLVEHFVRKAAISYRIVNKSQSPRRAYLELGVVDNARVQGADAVTYDPERKRALVVFRVAERSQREPGIVTEEGLKRKHDPDSFSADQLRWLSEERALPKVQRRLLARAAQFRARAEWAHDQARQLDGQIKRIGEDADRLRRNVSAFGTGSSAGRDRLAERLLGLETELDRTRKRQRELRDMEKREAKRARGELTQLGTTRR